MHWVLRYTQGCLEDVVSQQFAQSSMALPICYARWMFFAHSAPVSFSICLSHYPSLLYKLSPSSGASRFNRVLPDGTKQCGECGWAWYTSGVKQDWFPLWRMASHALFTRCQRKKGLQTNCLVLFLLQSIHPCFRETTDRECSRGLYCLQGI